MKKANRIATSFGKTFLAILLLLSVLLLASCGSKGYAEIQSSSEDSKVIATIGSHDVKFELFRAFFSSMYSGRTEGWEETDWEDAKQAVFTEIAYLYAIMDVAEAAGIDPYGDKINADVSERVTIDIEGGESNGFIVEGAGSKEAYRKALEALNLTDAVNRLIYRSDATASALYDYLITNFGNGTVSGSLEEAEEFFVSENCAKGVWIFISDELRGGRENALSYAEEVKESLSGANSYAPIRSALIRTMSDYVLSADEIENGFYVAKHQGNSTAERQLVSDIFTLSPYSCGEPVESESGVFIAVSLPKSNDDFSNYSDFILDLMLEEKLIGSPVATLVSEMLTDIGLTSAFPAFTEETLASLTLGN